ncbi:MAG: sugar transporter, partial [Halomonadaceae bacterium]
QVQTTEAMGRLVVDLERVLDGTLPGLEVMDGDRLRIPRRSQSVSVFGEVQFASSHLYEPALAVTDYLDRSGGFTAQADERRVYVIRANGSVWRPDDSRWFRGGGEQLRPGDTIVSPIKLDRVNQLQLASNISQIFSNLAISAAALNSF